MNSAPCPATLLTLTPTEGQTLARRLAERALAERLSSTRDLAALSAPFLSPLMVLTAAYFQARGFRQRGLAEVATPSASAISSCPRAPIPRQRFLLPS
jgi:hypothetical protein